MKLKAYYTYYTDVLCQLGSKVVQQGRVDAASQLSNISSAPTDDYSMS